MVGSYKAISSKIAKSTGIIVKSRQLFLSNTLCTLYNSLILPYLQYCSIIWASTYSSHLQPLFRLQKKALRIITHSPPRAHTYSLFNKFKILSISNIYKYQVTCFVFLHMRKLLPSPLSSLFVLNSDCHQYLTWAQLFEGRLALSPGLNLTLVSFSRGGSRIFFRRGCTRLLLYFNTNKPHSFFFAEYQLY